MSSRVTVDGSVLGHTLWGRMEDVTGILVADPELLMDLQVALFFKWVSNLRNFL